MIRVISTRVANDNNEKRSSAPKRARIASYKLKKKRDSGECCENACMELLSSCEHSMSTVTAANYVELGSIVDGLVNAARLEKAQRHGEK